MKTKDEMTPMEKVDAGFIIRERGIGGIDIYVMGALSHALEQAIQRAIEDLPDSNLEDIVSAITAGQAAFMETITPENTRGYASQFKKALK